MSNLVKVKFRIPPDTQRLLNSKWRPEDGRGIMQIVEDELALHNFPSVWRNEQGKWMPLSHDYQKWKEKNYPGKKKWELTGAAMSALGTPANLSVSGGHASSKHITLDHARRGIVVAEYEIRRPAAGGYFDRINALRLMWQLTDKSRAAILDKGYKYLGAMMKKAGWGKK